jgi:hypothetical protein
MSAYSFGGYCYASADDALAVAQSYVGQSSGGWLLESVSNSAGTFSYTYLDPTGAEQTVSHALAVCASPGPLSPYVGSGLSVADAMSLSFAVVGVWTVAYIIATVRRAMYAGIDP